MMQEEYTTDITVHTPVVNSRMAMEYVVAAQGNFPLAAELAGTSEAMLVAALTLDANASEQLARYLRNFTVIKLFGTMDQLQRQVISDIADGNLKGRDLAKVFTTVADIMTRLTDDKTTTQNINVYEQAMKRIPPEVRQALELIAGGKSDMADSA